MSGGSLEKSINQSNWKDWLKKSNLLFIALNITKYSYVRHMVDHFQSQSSKVIEQQQESTLNLANQNRNEQQRQEDNFLSIISEYANNQTQDSLMMVKQLYNSGDVFQAYSLLSQMLVQSNKSDKAINLLKAGVKKIQELKEKGSTVYIEDQVDLKQRLILLKAVKQKKYQDSLKQLNTIYETNLQYFMDHRITFLNNLSLAIQKSQRTDKYQESITYLHEALNLQQKYMLLKDERIYYTLNNLACAYFQNGDRNKAHELFNKLVRQMQSQRQKYQQILKICQNNYKYYFHKELQ